MNLRQLELFVAIAETGSFSAGAEKVSLTQSTVSQHVAALEAETGCDLFDRMARGVTLTPGGRLFMKHARRVLAERDALLQAMTGFHGLEDAEVTIGASNIPANYLVPQLLSQMRVEYPGISLRMIASDTRDVLDRLEHAEIELAVVGSRLARKTVEFQPLLNDPMALVVGTGHRWAGQERISVAELLAEPMVTRENGSGSGRSLDSALRQIGHDPEELTVAACLGSNEAVLQAVVNGFGCAFVSALSVKQSLVRKELHVLNVEGLIVERKIWLARLHARTASPAAQAFAALLHKVYAT